MKKVGLLAFVFFSLLVLSSCQRTSSQTWENMKTAKNFFQEKYNAILGKLNGSKTINKELKQPKETEFIGLNEADLRADSFNSDAAISQSNFLPGEEGSPVPSIEKFSSPEGELKALFKKIHFATDDHIVRSQQDLETIAKIALYLKNHPKYFVSIEGHCDERASSAYNLALGTRRANQIRLLLIKLGVDNNRLFTISYGKERPLLEGHDRNSWDQNRRGEFKLFTK